MKKLIGLLAALLLLNTVIFAGGGKEELISDDSDGTGEKTKIVFLRAGIDVERKLAYNKIIDMFEEENPDITIEYQEAPWGNDIETKLNTGFASGTAADVINYSLASMGQRIPMGQYECLNEYTINWEGQNDYYPSVLAAGSVGDDLYGIGSLADPRLLVYNKALFEKAGLDPNAPPRNWEELKEYHEKLIIKDANGTVIQTGFGLPTMGFDLNQWLSMFGFQNGMKNLVDEVTNEILFNQAGMVEAATFMDELRKMGVIPWDSQKMDQNPFVNGTAAISIISPNDFNTINTGNLKGNIAMTSPFSQKVGGTFCGMHFMFMNANSKNKDAAWRFIEFFTSEKAMSVWFEMVGTAPLRHSLGTAYLEQDPEKGRYVLDAIAVGTGSPKVSYFNTLQYIVNDAMEKIFYEQATPQQALDEAAEKLQKEIDDQ